MEQANTLNQETIDRIEYQAQAKNTIAWKFPRAQNLIQYGAQIIIPDDFSAVVKFKSKYADQLNPGQHTLNQENLSKLLSLKEWKQELETHLDVDLVFVTTTEIENLKFAIPKLMIRLPATGMEDLRIIGTYSLRLIYADQFLKSFFANQEELTTVNLSQAFLSLFVDEITETLERLQIPRQEWSSNLQEIGDLCADRLKAKFQKSGVELLQFTLEQIISPRDQQNEAPIQKEATKTEQSGFQEESATNATANKANWFTNLISKIFGAK